MIILTCEHASPVIPPRWAPLFEEVPETLAGHRGYDTGAGDLACFLAGRCGVTLLSGEVSRLLGDLNRREGSRTLFSPCLSILGRQEKEKLIARYHRPWRESLVSLVRGGLDRGETVMHLSIHSFMPEREGRRRNTCFGILYDPARGKEKELSLGMAAALQEEFPLCRIRRNYPFRGTGDGTTSWLRSLTGSDRYIGVELEINRNLLSGDTFGDPFKQRVFRGLGSVLFS
jgi:predicted N-formylglutamate amidohydrolase